MSVDNEEALAEIAYALDNLLPRIYQQPMGFVLLTVPLKTDETLIDYVSNCSRKDIAAALRTAADILETREGASPQDTRH